MGSLFSEEWEEREGGDEGIWGLRGGEVGE